MSIRKTLSVIFVLLSLVLFIVAPTLAQEATETAPGEVPSSGESDEVIVTPNDREITPGAAMIAIGLLSSGVAFAMEGVIKPILKTLPFMPKRLEVDPVTNTSKEVTDTYSPMYSTTAKIAAFILAMVTIFALNDPRNNILAALAVFPRTPLLFAQLLTGAAVTFGDMFLHSLYDYVTRVRGTAIITPMLE